MDLNVAPEIEKEGERQNNNTVDGVTNEPQDARFGPWMLVNRKSKAVAGKKNNKKTKRKGADKHREGNQFDVLRDATVVEGEES